MAAALQQDQKGCAAHEVSPQPSDTGEGLTLSFPFVTTTTTTTKTWQTETGVIDVDEAQVFSHSNPRPKHPLVWQEIFGTAYRKIVQLPPRTYPALPSILI